MSAVKVEEAPLGIEPGSAKEVEILGLYTQEVVEVEDLIMLSQVRGGANPESKRLKQSIDRRGLINEIDIARMTRENLEQYIDFVNRLWGTSLDIANYDVRARGGLYYLVIAGHSRTLAVLDLAYEHPEKQYKINCKVHDVKGPGDIIGLQLDENLYHKPPVERSAMAIIESYHWGIESGKWSGKTEYLALHKGEVGSAEFEKALGFHQLPADLRRLVFGKQIPYTAALELGGHIDTWIHHETIRLGYASLGVLSEEQAANLEEVMKSELLAIIAYIQNHKLNTTASKLFIQGKANTWQSTIEQLQAQKDEQLALTFRKDQDASEVDDGLDKQPDAEEDEFALFTFTQQDQQYVQQRRRDLDNLLRQTGQMPVVQAEALLSFADDLKFVDSASQRRALAQAAEKAITLLGEGPLAEAISGKLDEMKDTGEATLL